MNQKPKTDFVAILVYLAMIFLVAIIVLPPVLRMLLPKEVAKTIEQEKLDVLICNKQVNNVSVRSITTYKNNQLFRVILNYSNKVEENQSTEASNNPFVEFEEIAALKTVSGVQMTKTADEVKIDMTEKVFLENVNNETLSKYTKSIVEQQAFYKEDGYICQVTNN